MASGGTQELRLTFDRIVDWSKGELPFGAQLSIKKGLLYKDTLSYFVGDPDEGRIMVFEKHTGSER